MPEQDLNTVDALVVGAGFAGMYQLYKLREAGFEVRCVEAGSGVGGTWFWNRYPGARCDVEALSYSYSFSPELEQEWEWSQKYPPQAEILSYLDHVADRFDLRELIQFENRVTTARFDEDTDRWRAETDAGLTFDTQFLIMATGCLSQPKEPDIPHVDRFEGPTYRTGTWPDETVDFAGKRIGVVGTGSSGIQVIPVLAKEAEQVVVFQRTPNFCLPARNRTLPPEEVAERKGTYREWRAAQRSAGYGVPANPPTRSALEVAEAARDSCFQGAWDDGDLVAMLGSYTDLLVDEDANETVSEFIRRQIREIVDDPEVAEKLSPRSFPFGTKRPCLGTDYYETFNRDNVDLVDLRETPIKDVTADGVTTTASHHELDVLILATGFDGMTGALMAIEITGVDGVTLAERWADGPRTYLGLAVSGFPNLFTITGPLSPGILSNVVVAVELDAEWITTCLERLREQGVTRIEAEREPEDEWVAHVAEIASETLYPRANSWWIGANVPGKPRTFMIYVAGLRVYQDKCEEIAAGGYTGFQLGAPAPV
jgi:cation diffusion facilitator CzcD-associated flavoprotein CzcO